MTYNREGRQRACGEGKSEGREKGKGEDGEEERSKRKAGEYRKGDQ